MGYIKHHSIVVTSQSEDIKKAHEKAKEIFGKTCSELVNSDLNGYRSFFIAPNGSKEGWADSDEGNKRRESFRRWLNSFDDYHYIDAVEIYYGGDGSDFIGINEMSRIT